VACNVATSYDRSPAHFVRFGVACIYCV
jgi:hypothetical protein